MFLAVLAKDCINKLALAHLFVNLNVKLLAGLTQLSLAHACDVNTCILFDCLKHRKSSVTCCKINLCAVDIYFCSAVYCCSNSCKHLLHKVHHPVVVLVCNVDLHTGELRVVGSVHTLVTEVLCKLVYTVVTSNDKAFQIKLICNTQVQRHIQSVVVGNERSCGCTSRDWLKDRGLNLKAASLVKETAHGRDDFGPLHECLPNLRVNDKVYISLAVSQLRIRECIKHLTILLLDDREHAQRFAQHCKLFCVDRFLACLGNKSKTFDTYNISNIKQFLENCIVKGLVLTRANLVPLHINLYPSALIHKLNECCSTHNSAAHDTAGNHNICEVALLRVVSLPDVLSCCIYRKHCSRIRLNAKFPHLYKSIAPVLLLLVQIQFHICVIFNFFRIIFPTTFWGSYKLQI